MRFMRLPGLCLFLSCASVCAAGGPLSAAAPAAAAPATPTVPQPALPGEPPGAPPPAGVLPTKPVGESTPPVAVAQPAVVEGNPDWAETLERIAKIGEHTSALQASCN